jgi:hypothetical protein
MFLMLDLRFKSFPIISFFVDREEVVSIVDEYDTRTLYPMFLKCYHHLHPMTKFVGCVDQTCDENFSLNIFQQIAFTSEPSKEIYHQGIIDFQTLPSGSQRHQVSSSMVGKA